MENSAGQLLPIARTVCANPLLAASVAKTPQPALSAALPKFWLANLDESETTWIKALKPFWETHAKGLSLLHHWFHAQANITLYPIVPL